MFRNSQTLLCWALAALMTVPPTVASGADPAGGGPAAGKLDLTYVTRDAALAAVAHPRRVLTASEMQMLPVEVLSALGKKELGIDPVDVEQLMVVVEPPLAGPPGIGVVVRFARPFDWHGLTGKVLDQTVAGELDGRAYRRGQGAPGLSVFMPHDNVLIVATDDLLRRMVAQREEPAAEPLSKLLARIDPLPDVLAVLAVEPIRDMVVGQLAVLPDLPAPFTRLKDIPKYLAAVELKLNVQGDALGQIVLRATDDEAAGKLEEMLDTALADGRRMLLAQLQKQADSEDPVERAAAAYMKRISASTVDRLRPVREGDRLVLTVNAQQHTQIAAVGVLVALLLPAVQAAREAARRMQSVNNLKQLAIAMHNYHDTHGRFPPRAKLGPDGKPLLSWRVLILPYVEGQTLYDQFHLDEPWDSAHNRQLVQRMPEVYRSPNNADAKDGKTNYLAPVGAGTIFSDPRGMRMAEIRDGMSNTVMLVEADNDRAVEWTRPDDLAVDERRPLQGLGQLRPGGFNAALADGSVRFVSNAVDPAVWRALLTAAGGEPAGEF